MVKVINQPRPLKPNVYVYNVQLSFQVLAMLMGEYEYTINFVSNPAAGVMSKILFVIFVIDMSVVLMNLVISPKLPKPYHSPFESWIL